MQQHLGRLDGVAKVDVNLLDGKVVLHPKPDGTIDPAKVLKATYDSGVTVAEMTMTASGRLSKDTQGDLVFQAAANQSFPVRPNELSREVERLIGSGAEIVLRGRLYQKPAGKQKFRAEEHLRFEILEVLKKE